MPDTTLTLACPSCGDSLASLRDECPHCHVSADWINLFRAFDFAQQRFDEWRQQGVLRRDQYAAIIIDAQERRKKLLEEAHRQKELPPYLAARLPALRRCWSCDAADVGGSHCGHCGAPADGDDVRRLRYWSFLCHEVRGQEQAGRLSLAGAHQCLAEARERVAALQRRLETARIIPMVEAARPAPTPRPERAEPAQPRRPLWELLLDPRSIQWLLAFGGALLVLGLVIWLATLGVFENPIVLAAILGAGNAALLAGGGAVIRFTRYQTAGRAVTLLACLVMPLNLWFYHAQGLISLEGHLWGAALVCCVLYAAAALVLRDQLFVYVLMGGVALTGLLILCDLNKFIEIAAPSTLLMVLGLIGIHAERAFPDEEGVFTRKQFGMAFFWSGQALLGAGLLLLFGAHVAGDWLYEPVFRPLYTARGFGQPAVVAELSGRLLALGLVLAGTYAYLYSDLVVRRVGVYVYLAAFTLLWAEVLLIQMLHLDPAAVITALALTALAVNVAQVSAAGRAPYLRAVPVLGLSLSLLPVLLGVVLHFRATSQLVLAGPWGAPLDWKFVGAMLVTAAVCRASAFLYRHTIPWLSAGYFFATAAATLVGAAGLLRLLEMSWSAQAPLLMLIPIAYLIAARLYRGHTAERPLLWVGHAATVVMLLSSLVASLEGFTTTVSGKPSNLSLALFCAEASGFYALAAAFTRHGPSIYLCTTLACGAVWQLLSYWGIEAEYYALAFAVLGLGLLVAYRLAVLERVASSGLAGAAFQSANALLSLSFVASLFITLSRLAAGIIQRQQDWSAVGLAGLLLVLSLVAAGLVNQHGWRRWYVIMAIAEGGLAFLTLHVLSHLSPWQKLEIFCVVIGLALLVVGHIGWHREHDRHNDLVSLSLMLGSVLVGLPLTVAVLIHRVRPEFSTLNELGLLAAGVLLLASGFVLQLRSTTLTGAFLLMIYLVTLVMYVNALEKIQTAAIWLALAGGTIFGSAILLSVYRDRLLMLPDKVKRSEGVFRVLGWR